MQTMQHLPRAGICVTRPSSFVSSILDRQTSDGGHLERPPSEPISRCYEHTAPALWWPRTRSFTSHCAERRLRGRSLAVPAGMHPRARSQCLVSGHGIMPLLDHLHPRDSKGTMSRPHQGQPGFIQGQCRTERQLLAASKSNGGASSRSRRPNVDHPFSTVSGLAFGFEDGLDGQPSWQEQWSTTALQHLLKGYRMLLDGLRSFAVAARGNRVRMMPCREA